MCVFFFIFVCVLFPSVCLFNWVFCLRMCVNVLDLYAPLLFLCMPTVCVFSCLCEPLWACLRVVFEMFRGGIVSLYASVSLSVMTEWKRKQRKGRMSTGADREAARQL